MGRAEHLTSAMAGRAKSLSSAEMQRKRNQRDDGSAASTSGVCCISQRRRRRRKVPEGGQVAQDQYSTAKRLSLLESWNLEPGGTVKHRNSIYEILV